MKISVRITPNAKRSEIVGEEAGVIKIKIAAPPVDGKANEELLRFLAEHYRVPRSHIRILRGTAGRQKIIEIIAR